MGAVFRRRDPPQELPGRSLVARAPGGLAWIAVGVADVHRGVVRRHGVDGGYARRRIAPAAGPGRAQTSRSSGINGGGRCATSTRIRPDLHHRERDPHPGGTAGARQARGRRCHPFVLGAGAGWKDRPHPGPDQHDLARGRQPPASTAANAPNIAASSTRIWGCRSIASAPDEFEAWRDNQLEGAAPAISPNPLRERPERLRRANAASATPCAARAPAAFWAPISAT